MKSRKQRAIKGGSSRRKAPSDVSPSTSLPPLVEGQLRCFLRVTVSRMLWTIHKPPSATFIRLRWWGESTNGTHFFPRDASQLSQKTIKTTARFPIRCGPKQFTSYLTDMGSLVLEVLTKPDHLPIARAQVAGISRLSLSQPISGFYTLVSPTSEKLGELQVSGSLNFHSHANCICGIVPVSSAADIQFLKPTFSLISVILDRGNKLRNAMVVSALKCDMDSAPSLKDTPLPLPKDNIQPPAKSFFFFFHFYFFCIYFFSAVTSPLPLWDGQGSSPGSLSDHSSVCEDSELNDPQYDQSLLENLFYKTPISVTKSDDTEEEPQKRKSSKAYISLCTFKTVINCILTVSSPRSEHQQPADAAGVFPHLSAEQLSFLSLIRLARVTIDSLTVPAGSSTTTPRKSSNKGKPPRPVISKKCTYFVEYVFPVTSSSSQHDRSRTGGGGEVTRAVSSKVTGGAVRFHQLSVFPVHLSPAAVKQWWESDLIFKIYSRKSDQKKPVAVGKAVHPLRSLLKNKQLSQSVVLPVQNLDRNCEAHNIGPLKVRGCFLFTKDTVFTGDVMNKLTWSDTSAFQTAHSPERETISRSQHAGMEELPARSLEDSKLNVWTPQKPSKGPSSHPGLRTSPPKSWQQVEEDPEVLLHALLMVPDGKNFSCGPTQAPNVYLNCKQFWCDETARSVVSWGQTNPTFNFVQVTPVALTTKLLERMKNNMMVIEVWQKTGSSGQDRLLGLAQYPVLGVDCYMPVIDVFSGSCKGNLRVVLAMGRSEQIVSLQRTRDEEHDSLSHLVRPVHLLDHQPHSQTKVKHVFAIRVERVSGLTPLQSTVWGEADCYIQYSFPCQEGDVSTILDHDLIESVNLKPFRTTTTLCIPDPVFGHTETHVLVAPEGVPVQRLLLSSLSSRGLSGGGGVQFEVWCRYYYPNVRDQLVARGMLPLSKLCAMVTMQRQHPDEAQMFSLPLIPRTDVKYYSLLDVCIRYKHRPVRPEGQAGRGAASRVVTLVVQVHRASGLKTAARVLSEQDERFGYFAGVGVNTFVTVQLSFLPESERRCTRTAARTFCPEFDHHMEVSCDLLLQRSSGETCSLAEQLEQASIPLMISVCNICSVLFVVALDISKPKDVILGTVKIPLADLIHKRTGISGWFGVYITQETSSSQHQHVLVGGLELSVCFAHHSDRERVIKAAQGLGWEMPHKDSALQDDEENWEESLSKLSFTLSMPRVWIPVHCLLLPGHSELQRSTYCYFRYKFYDQEAFCSQMKHPCVVEGGEEDQATVSFEGSRSVELRSTQPLTWYLREERLEVQVWVAFKKDKARRPSDTDRLVGSAFVDLSSLAKTPKQKLTLSGVYPLFRRSAADLQGAALRVHITLTAGSDPRGVSGGADTQLDSDSQEELLLEEAEAADRVPSPTTPRKTFTKHMNKSSRSTPDITSVQHIETSTDESFPVTVAVDRAMHLDLKGCPLAERSEGSPCCCVSYVTADSAEPVSTAVVSNTDCPVWDHQHECRLLKQLLVDPQQSLVFKVWHKGEIERVIGFASVDLSPLLCGFPSVCGWYNITDFSGQCHGQLKVSITPLRGVQDLREQRKTVTEEAAKSSPVRALQLYRDVLTLGAFSDLKPTRVESDRHFEHMDKVRLYHQNLQEQTASQSVCSSSGTDINPSSSFLFSTLRKLSELDNIQKYFSRKLSTPTFPPMTEQDYNTRHEGHRDSETDTSQLLLKSNQLVGEVNNIISGELSTTSPVGDNNIQTFPDSVSSPNRVSDCSLEILSPQPSPLPEMPEDQTDSEPEEEKDKHEVNMSEDEDEEQHVCRRDEEDDDDEEEDEDYEEVVVKPRPLNDVTSLTDKTSPWTSIMSEPDLVSLGSLEAPEEPNMSEDDEEKQMVNLETHDSSRKHNSIREEQSEHQSFNRSDEDTSDAERDDERTLQTLGERQTKEPNSPDEGSGDKGSSAPAQDATDTHNASSSLDNHLQTYP
uniref:C2 domain containing 3 centriole elongation regulator n=1 Tax=Stegastes partitus TaxID=144197 RepID=A0A3B5A3F2_9TELE